MQTADDNLESGNSTMSPSTSTSRIINVLPAASVVEGQFDCLGNIMSIVNRSHIAADWFQQLDECRQILYNGAHISIAKKMI